jgi:hypothetical protein
MSVSRFIKAPLHKRWTNNTFGRILQRSCTTVHSATSNEPKPYDLPSHARVVICGGGVTGTSNNSYKPTFLVLTLYLV